MKLTVTRIAPALAALALAACGEPEEPSYEADATDMSGGELIVSDEDPAAVPVDTPDTEMTMTPDMSAEGDMATEEAAPAE